MFPRHRRTYMTPQATFAGVGLRKLREHTLTPVAPTWCGRLWAWLVEDC